MLLFAEIFLYVGRFSSASAHLMGFEPLYATAAAMNEMLWLKGLLLELDVPVHGSPVLIVDNQSAKSIAENGVKTERTKHVDVKYHFVTELLENETFKLNWVKSEENQAD